MRQKAQHAADDRAIVNTPLAAGQQARAKAQYHKGDEVVADDGGPVNGELVADEVGDGAVHQARQRAQPQPYRAANRMMGSISRVMEPPLGNS